MAEFQVAAAAANGQGVRAKAPCRFFASGACRNGNTCPFAHAAAAAPPSPTSTDGATSPRAPSSKPCIFFFQRGECRNGAACTFSHGAAGAVRAVPAEPDHLAALAGNYDAAVAVDVECVATGLTHLDRAVASVGAVDVRQQLLLDAVVKPAAAVISYLEPLTGLNAALVDGRGVALDAAVAQLRAALSPTAVLVGTNISKDVEWLSLREGVDFAAMIDLAALFRCWEPAKQRYVYFGQDHVARCWLNAVRAPGQSHDAVGDARISMALLHAYASVRHDPARLEALRQATLRTPREPSFAMKHPVFEGVCQGNRKLCTCGAPHFS
ncbi:hypothetical protein M885DRAFT_452380 [Pelagophyceae sp. CCMP2097]|nr:hypothetical protein M885DRAFT_452380 [Pelagophyceae sp. CCMP2097]